jgi:uncharacterized membrane protein
MEDINKLRSKVKRRNAVKILFGFFIKGLLFLLPIGLTVYIIYKAIAWVDSIINVSIPWGSIDGVQQYVHLPGFGILVVLTAVTLVGVFVTYLITEPISKYFESLLNRIPVFKLIYSSIKDFMEAFFGDEKKFNEPVIAQINELGIKKVGFITQKDLAVLGLKDEVGVYFPHSYNFSGEFFIIPSKYVKPLSINSSEVMKFTVSGGVSDL